MPTNLLCEISVQVKYQHNFHIPLLLPNPPPPPPDIQIENINLIYNVPINLLVSDVNDTF